MWDKTQVKVSICQGEYQVIDKRLQRVGRTVIIDRPGKEPRYYEKVGGNMFKALIDLIRRHELKIWPWSTMVGYTCYWTPGTRAQEEVGGGDKS